MPDGNAISPPSLPTEVWLKITYFAAEPIWPDGRFYPPEKNVARIIGFKYACRKFQEIVEIVDSETLHISSSSAKSELRSSARNSSANLRNIHIQLEAVRESRTMSELILSSRLHSFSIRTGEDIMTQEDDIYYELMGSLRRSPSLQTLMQLALNVTSHLINRETTNISQYHNLRELSLYSNMPYVFILSGMPQHDDDSVWTNPIATKLSSLVSSLPRLRHLSLHIHINTLREIQSVTRIHEWDLDHLQPSEGYSRHYSECPMCTEVYDHNRVVERENSEVQAFAEICLSLEVVSFMHYWRRTWKHEEGQRKIRIVRNGNNIVIDREWRDVVC